MCGICAYIGYEDAYKYVYFGLCMLQNRGYDSSGICGIDANNKFVIRKFATKPDCPATKMLENMDSIFHTCTNAILHTRWATTGAKTDENAHPHLDYTGQIALVHNGIIENYEEIKNDLIKHDVIFKSQTDSEVIVNLIGFYHNKLKNINMAIKMALEKLEGSWALVIINTAEPNKMYCARHGSPLLIGFSKDSSYAMIASEQSGFCKYVHEYICLNDNDLVVLQKENSKIVLQGRDSYVTRNITVEIDALTPEPYAHWTLKEIFEQPLSCERAMKNRINNNQIVLNGLEHYKDQLIDVQNLILLGCGTSYNAGLHSLELFKKISGFNTVQIFDGAEFTEHDIPKIGKTAIILLSQSGETKDLYGALQIGKQYGAIMMGVVNVVDSLIAREVNCGIYINAGKEIGVASTKAFTSQIIVLFLIAGWFAQIKNINLDKVNQIIMDANNLAEDIKLTLDMIQDNCKTIGSYLLDQTSLFTLGRGMSEAIAKEGALKIKEIGYIHAEGYSSGALKHGPYSLIKKGLPTIIINHLDDYTPKNNSVIDEIKARDGYVINITDNNNINKNRGDIVVQIRNNNTFKGLLAVLPMQLIAYQLSCLKKTNPDLPFNLAKTLSTD